ncbi:MAG: kanamycin nucleotidyltransferase C-terminal domain-containing protein [Thermoplasmata archaeon]
MQHAERMRIAEEFVSLLRRKYNIRAAAVVGSTAKGKDMEHSDLEVAVIVGGKKPSDIHFVHRGIAVSVEFHTDDEIRQDLTVPRSWFVHIVNEYKLAHVLYDPENLYEDYKMLIANASDAFWREVAGHALAIAYEQLSKARNMGILGDEGKLRIPCVWFAETLAVYVAAVNRKVFTTTWDLYDSHNTFLDQPAKFAEAFPRLCGLVPTDGKELLPLAERLWESVLEHAESRDIRMTAHDKLEDSIAGR